jgi:hypothetical protein
MSEQPSVQAQAVPPQAKPDYAMYAAVLGIVFAILLPILQANGVEVNWIVSAVIYLIVLLLGIWTFAVHAAPHRTKTVRCVGTIVHVLFIGGLGYYGTHKQYRREHPLSVKSSVHPQNASPFEPSESANKELVTEKTSLHDLYESDFDYMKSGTGFPIRRSSDGLVLARTEGQVCFDFKAQAKFLIFYIPNSPDTFELCKTLAVQHPEILASLQSWGIVEEKAPGDQRRTEGGELKFTGRVFIYHEDYLLQSQIDALQPFYKERGLSLLLRGPEYLFARQHPPKFD